MRGCLLLVAAGCGRIAFDALPGDATDGAAARDCWPQWKAGLPSLSGPARISELATDVEESNAWLAPDLHTLYFARDVGGTADIFVATRPDRTSAFGPAQLVGDLDTASTEARLAMDRGQRVGVFMSDRPPSQGTDIWYTVHNADGSFGTPTQAPLVNVNDANTQFDPELSADGLRLYLAPIAKMQHVFVASRTSLTDPFGTPTIVRGPDAFSASADPSISPDDLVIAFSAIMGAPVTSIWVETRTDTAAAFGNPVVLPRVGSTQPDRDSAFSADGCEVFLTSYETGNGDLYLISVNP